MDPVSQGVLGAALPQAVARRPKASLALICGMLGGLAPDLDVLIRSSSDPLLSLEYHRQFTHSLLFIPVGAALVALAVQGILGRSWHWRFRDVYLYCLLGYATHALLDACTTYGTQLFWPFSDRRVAWNNISVVDPMLTLPLLGGVLLAYFRRSVMPARIALIWCICYLMLGALGRPGAGLCPVRGLLPRRKRAGIESAT